MNNFESKLKAGNFVYNNGVVMRTMTIMGKEFHKLSGVAKVLKDDGITEGEFLDSIHFLSEDGYLELRKIGERTEMRLVDSEYRELEAMLTVKGIRFTRGSIKDDLIDW